MTMWGIRYYDTSWHSWRWLEEANRWASTIRLFATKGIADTFIDEMGFERRERFNENNGPIRFGFRAEELP
jgi:hypothetical protein